MLFLWRDICESFCHIVQCTAYKDALVCRFGTKNQVPKATVSYIVNALSPYRWWWSGVGTSIMYCLTPTETIWVANHFKAGEEKDNTHVFS